MFNGRGRGPQKGLQGGHSVGRLTGTKDGLVGRAMPPASSFDSDAWAYIQALQNTNTVIPHEWKIAINKFVRSGKAHGWWDAADCIYPIIGGTINAHAINLRNPNKYKVTWFGSTNHNLKGASIGGSTSQYGDTGYNPYTTPSNFTGSVGTLSCYVTVNPLYATGTALLGNLSAITTQLSTIRVSASQTGYESFSGSNSGTLYNPYPTAVVQGFLSYQTNGIPGQAKAFNNGQEILDASWGYSALFNGNMYILGANFGNANYNFNPPLQTFGFFYFGGSSFKQMDLYNDVQNLQVVLGRANLSGS